MSDNDKPDPKPVRLVSPNGMTVTVDETKVDARIAVGYKRPTKKRAASDKTDPVPPPAPPA